MQKKDFMMQCYDIISRHLKIDFNNQSKQENCIIHCNAIKLLAHYNIIETNTNYSLYLISIFKKFHKQLNAKEKNILCDFHSNDSFILMDLQYPIDFFIKYLHGYVRHAYQHLRNDYQKCIATGRLEKMLFELENNMDSNILYYNSLVSTSGNKVFSSNYNTQPQISY